MRVDRFSFWCCCCQSTLSLSFLLAIHFFFDLRKTRKTSVPSQPAPCSPDTHPTLAAHPMSFVVRLLLFFYTGPGPRTSQLQAIRTASAVVRREATVHKPFYDLGVNIPFFPFSRCVFEPRENPCKNLMATQRKMRLLFCVWVLCPFQPNSRIFSRFCFRYGLRRRAVLYRDGDPPPFSVMEWIMAGCANSS